MAKSRFARRLAARRVVVAISCTVIVGVGVASYAFLSAPRGIPLESYSGESGVKASVFVPSSGWNPATDAIELSAIVTARIDQGATCTLTATLGSVVEQSKTDALADASTMTCANMSVSLRGQQRGVWHIVVEYTAPGFAAESKPMEVEVGR